MTENKQTQMTLQNNRLALLFVAHDGGVMLGAVRDLKRGKERLSYLAPHFSLKAVRISDGSKLLVVRDSYSDALAPFLAQRFSEVHLLDLRYYRASAAQYAEENGIDAICVLYSVQNFISDRNLVLLTQ